MSQFFDTDLRVQYAIWHHCPELESKQLKKICRALTLHTLRLCSPNILKIDEDFSFSRILNTALHAGFDWCVVLTPGNIIKPGFFKEIKKICKDADADVLAFAHLVDRGDRGVGLNGQCTIVNLKAWNQIGRPTWGAPQVQPLELMQALRSGESVGALYRPQWLKPSAKTHTIVPKLWGWNFVDQGLRHGCRFEFVPGRARDKKAYIYPEQNSGSLLQSINDLDDVSLQMELSEHQKNVFKFLKMEAGGYARKIYPFNTEGYSDIYRRNSSRNLDTLYSVASGFKDLHILRHHGFTVRTNLVYFDISTQALFLKNYIFEHWDGLDFPAFLKNLLSQNRPELHGALFAAEPSEFNKMWSEELQHWASAEEFRDHYLKVRNLPREMLNLNVVADPISLTAHLNANAGGSLAVWYSNCFNYTPSVAYHKWDTSWIETQGIEFLEALHKVCIQKGIQAELYGEDVQYGSQCKITGDQIADAFI